MHGINPVYTANMVYIIAKTMGLCLFVDSRCKFCRRDRAPFQYRTAMTWYPQAACLQGCTDKRINRLLAL